jgi:hypothetical protein
MEIIGTFIASTVPVITLFWVWVVGRELDRQTNRLREVQTTLEELRAWMVRIEKQSREPAGGTAKNQAGPLQTQRAFDFGCKRSGERADRDEKRSTEGDDDTGEHLADRVELARMGHLKHRANSGVEG